MEWFRCRTKVRTHGQIVYPGCESAFLNFQFFLKNMRHGKLHKPHVIVFCTRTVGKKRTLFTGKNSALIDIASPPFSGCMFTMTVS